MIWVQHSSGEGLNRSVPLLEHSPRLGYGATVPAIKRGIDDPRGAQNRPRRPRHHAPDTRSRSARIGARERHTRQATFA